MSVAQFGTISTIGSGRRAGEERAGETDSIGKDRLKYGGGLEGNRIESPRRLEISHG